MQLKVQFDIENPKHTSVVTAVTWTSADEVLSCGDDHRILRWNVVNDDVIEITELPPDVHPISMQWPPKSIGGPVTGRMGNELLLVTATDGRFYLLGRGGRFEKSVQAHTGAVISGSWSPDGSEILTSGEDGFIRIWSRAGMLRSTLYHSVVGIYASCWGPDGLEVLYTNGKNLVIRPTSAGNKPNEWKAHDELVLCVAWNHLTRLIVSGGEDGRYNVWDTDGQLLYTSATHETPITAVAWSPSGDLFAVGGSDLIRLCDRFGWCHDLETRKLDTIYSIQWSSDGTQFAGSSADGYVFLANVLERTVGWKSMEGKLVSRRSVVVSELNTNIKDTIKFKDRVNQFSMNHGYLIVVIPMQVQIFNLNSIDSPVLCELKDNASVNLILQSKKNFMLCGSLGIASRTYEGRQVAHIKWPDMHTEVLNQHTVTLADDMIALIDQAVLNLIRVFDPQTGKSMTEIKMKVEVAQIALAQTEVFGPAERMLAVVDRCGDLFLVLLRRVGLPSQPKKLGMMVHSMIWHSEAPILAVVRDIKLRLFYFPQIVFIEESILDNTWEDLDLGELGRNPEIVSYSGSRVRIRRPDGVMVSCSANFFAPALHRYAVTGDFSKARKLCRYINDKMLWGVMAGLSTWKGDLGLAEICFGEIGHYDKVLFLKSIRETRNELTKAAHEQLFCGGLKKAETYLLKAGHLQEAIGLNVRCMHWLRALELTLKYGGNLELLMEARQTYLERLNLDEYLQDYGDLIEEFEPQDSDSETDSESESECESDSEDTEFE